MPVGVPAFFRMAARLSRRLVFLAEYLAGLEGLMLFLIVKIVAAWFLLSFAVGPLIGRFIKFASPPADHDPY